MAQDRAKQLLQQGISAAKAGQKDEARQALQQAVRLDPHNESIWLWLSSVARDDKERIFCLKQILEINPQNELAIKGLSALGIQPQQAAKPAAGVPVVTGEKLSQIEDKIDTFIRTYSPQPRTSLDVEWVHKEKKRYLEGSAARLRRTILASAAAVTSLIVVGFILLILSLDIEFPVLNEDERIALATLTPSATPTLTPTATPGVANTATPEPEITRTPIRVAENLPQGNVFQTTPTPAVPRYDVSVRLPVETAVFHFASGDYGQVAEMSADQRGVFTRDCFWELYYFEALSLMEQRQHDEAVDLLEQPLETEWDGESCQSGTSRAMIETGLCKVKLDQAVSNGTVVNNSLLLEAEAHCETALTEQQEFLPDGFNALADVRIALQQFDVAEELLDRGLEQFPDNRDLYLARADLELARNNPNDALLYIESALTIDPASEEGLRKRAEAYLMLARMETGDQQLLRYGEVALNTEDYLLFYPGNPAGHILLATARLNEGNPDRALESINRVIAAEDDLPPSARNAVIQAYALRSQIYIDQQNWGAALDDLTTLRELDPNNPTWVDRQTQIALQLDDFETVLENVGQALRDLPGRPDAVLTQARLLAITCQYNRNIDCDFETVLNNLTDSVIGTLSGEQRGQALLYRAEAQFQTIGEAATEEEIEAMLSSVNEALRLSQSPEAYFLLGRILEQMGNGAQALEAYEWLAYWTQFYDYPFSDEIAESIAELTGEEST
ncbi:MAG: tetratricopeptide repeat protein [Chloroflexi bacterium]|nr:tetratricopeptide repeat protein [Chloroflexota bacterium]